jgi:HTH-type transcriptional regulator, sugar sensing transcriptional regulator
MYIEELKEFGLSDKEAKVYLALLELEVATVNEVAKAAEVNRSSTYVVLEGLRKRGLVSVSAGNDPQKYVVAPPDKLLRLAEQRAREQEGIRKRIDEILPDLKSLYKGTKQKPAVRIFEGSEGVMTHMEESLKMKEKLMRIYASGRAPHDFYLEFLPKYFAAKQKAGIVSRGIHPNEQSSWEIAKHQPKTDESVFVDPNRYKFVADFVIYDDTVAYISHQGEHAITIESPEIAEAMKSAFDLAFEGAKNAQRSGSLKRAS